MPEPRDVRAMFARIAGRYDLLNHLLSAGIDRRWRRALLELAADSERSDGAGASEGVRGRVVVDACCGTGDVALEFARSGARVVGVDFTPEMLVRARAKSAKQHVQTLFAHGDALRLPVKSSSADVCTNAFGIRNVQDRRAGVREMLRVLRPGGRVLILEFSMPPGRILGALYRAYFTRVLPRVGKLVSRHGDAYAYLPRTVLAWPSPAEFQRELELEGLVECGHRRLTRGVACIHWGRAPTGDLVRSVPNAGVVPAPAAPAVRARSAAP